MHGSHESPRERRRLESWKEIAAYFGRDERTVKRWEKEKGLPVHRMPENTGARVFAFTDELSRWIARPEPSGAKAVQEPDPQPEVPSEGSENRHIHFRRIWVGLGVAAVIFILAAAMIASRHQGRHPATSDVSGKASTSSSSTTQTDAAARELYLTGQYYWDKRTPADLNMAVQYFNRAIERDPKYAEAYVGLANCYSLLREFSAMPSEEAFPRALTAARKAVELDASSAQAHNALAFVTFYWDWDVEGAEQEFRRALELDPNYVTAHHWYATFLMVLGRFPEALQQIDIARQLDPASTAVLADKALILYHSGDKEQAISLLKQLSVSPVPFFSTHQYLSFIYLNAGNVPLYLEEAGKAAALSHDAHETAIMHEAENGYRAGGEEQMLQRTLEIQLKYFEQGNLPAFCIAETYARLADRKNTLYYLETSFHRHEVPFLSIRVHEPFFFLHKEPAFQHLVEEAGLPSLS